VKYEQNGEELSDEEVEEDEIPIRPG